MSMRSLCACLIAMTVMLGPVVDSRANTAVAARDYALQVTHSEISRAALEGGLQGLELKLNIANQGAHDLYDVRVYLQEAADYAVLDRREPARLRTLPAGKSETLTWTFETSKRLEGSLRNVVFRIEAVDQATQEIVTFNQKSMEAR